MFCPQCGAPNEEDAIFCGNCGAVLTADEGPAAKGIEMPEEVSAAEPEVETPDEFLTEEAVEPARPVVPPPPPQPPLPPRPASAIQTSGMAIASLVMGITGWTVLPLLGSILAIVFGYAARKEIRQRPGELGGDGLAVAGLVLGWLMVGLTVIGLCLGGLALCFFIPFSRSSGF